MKGYKLTGFISLLLSLGGLALIAIYITDRASHPDFLPIALLCVCAANFINVYRGKQYKKHKEKKDEEK